MTGGEGHGATELIDNPFRVLGLQPECSRAEVERAGQKLMAMLELGLAGAERYQTPFGPGRRDPAKVRAAMAELRDPQRRLFHELWMADPSGALAASGPSEDADTGPEDSGFSAARSALGWG